MFSRMEDERLDFIRKGKAVQAEHLRKLANDHDFAMEDHNDHEDPDDDDNTDEDSRFHPVLPASFTGSPKYFSERTADALALSRQRGKPDLMITATTNPRWPELLQKLLPGQSAAEVPHITNRVFKVRFRAILYLIIIYMLPRSVLESS